MPDSVRLPSGTLRTAPQRHVVIYGAFGYSNTGNDATLAVTLDLLRELMPGAELTVAALVPEKVAARHGVRAVPIRPEPRKGQSLSGPLRKLVREADRFGQIREILATADCLMIPGTGIFDDFNVTAFEAAYPLWQWCRQARSVGASVKFVSIGAGPIQRPLSRFFFRRAALLADYRSYRDMDSRDFVRDRMKVNTAREVVTPDLVFGMASEAAPAPPVQGPPRVVAVGTMVFHSWSGRQGGPDDVYHAYLDKMLDVCCELLAGGAALRLLTADPGDRPATQALLERLHKAEPERAHMVTAPQTATFADIHRQVATADAVIASRFHTIVAAMMCGRPAVSMGYTPKNSEVMKLFGQGRFCQNIWDFDPAVTLRHFSEATRDPLATFTRLGVDRARLAREVREHMTGVANSISVRSGRKAGPPAAPAAPAAHA